MGFTILLSYSGSVIKNVDLTCLQEKQKTKVKEKLDKCVKDTLVDLCDLFEIPVSKTNTRKVGLHHCSNFVASNNCSS